MRLTELVTPLKPLEAMAQERIVVASDIGGHRELDSRPRDRLSVPPGDPVHVARGIFAALDDRASWPLVQARALQYVETERSWVHSVARYAPVYERLTTRPATGGAVMPTSTEASCPKTIHLIAAARPNFMKIAPLFHQLKDRALGPPGADPYRPAL